MSAKPLNKVQEFIVRQALKIVQHYFKGGAVVGATLIHPSIAPGLINDGASILDLANKGVIYLAGTNNELVLVKDITLIMDPNPGYMQPPETISPMN